MERKKRKIIHSGLIGEALVNKVLKDFPVPNGEPEQEETEYVFVLNSDGGSVSCAYAILDHFDQIRNVTTIATGECMSAAPVIIAAGTKGRRFATYRTRFMLHPATESASDATYGELRALADELEMSERRYAEALAEYTRKSAKWWLAKQAETNDPWYFGPETAVQIGIIDRVIEHT